MAWTRRPRGRRRFGGRRFVRRRFRATTEQGGRFERCFFNFEHSLIVGPGGTDTRSSISIVSGMSFIPPAAAASADLGDFARMLATGQRGIDVVALIFDWVVLPEPGFVAPETPPDSLYDYRVVGGTAVYSDRLTQGGTAETVPNYPTTQWPVLQTVLPDSNREDVDYGMRTHYHRAFDVLPAIASPSGDVAGITPGWPRARGSARVKINRRFGDTHGLFFSQWLQVGSTFVTSSTAQLTWHYTGSLWYKLRW